MERKLRKFSQKVGVLIFLSLKRIMLKKGKQFKTKKNPFLLFLVIKMDGYKNRHF